MVPQHRFRESVLQVMATSFPFSSSIKKVKSMYYAVLFCFQPLGEHLLQTGADANDSIVQTAVNLYAVVGASDWAALHVVSLARHTDLVEMLAIIEALASTEASTAGINSPVITIFFRTGHDDSIKIVEFFYKADSNVSVQSINRYANI